MEARDGGAAYPRTGVGSAGKTYDVPSQDGMSLRDWFAGKAIEGIVAPAFLGEGSVPLAALMAEVEAAGQDVIARLAYSVADAMLAERARQSPAPLAGPEGGAS